MEIQVDFPSDAHLKLTVTSPAQCKPLVETIFALLLAPVHRKLLIEAPVEVQDPPFIDTLVPRKLSSATQVDLSQENPEKDADTVNNEEVFLQDDLWDLSATTETPLIEPARESEIAVRPTFPITRPPSTASTIYMADDAEDFPYLFPEETPKLAYVYGLRREGTVEGSRDCSVIAFHFHPLFKNKEFGLFLYTDEVKTEVQPPLSKENIYSFLRFFYHKQNWKKKMNLEDIRLTSRLYFKKGKCVHRYHFYPPESL